MKLIETLHQKQLKTVPELRAGDTVRVHTKIIEGSKERVQVFEGVVLRVKGGGVNQTFTVRKISYNVGVERTFLTQSPKLAKIEIKKRSKVRRAYLTYLRGLRGKAAKLKDTRFDMLAVNVVPEELKPEDLVAPIAEEALDAEITEISEQASDVKEAENIEEVIAEELSEAAVNVDDDESEAPEVEVEIGEASAENDLEKGKDSEGEKAEGSIEDEAAKA